MFFELHFFLSATWQPCCQLRAPTKGTATSLVQLSNVNHCIMLIFARPGGHREPYNEVGSWNLGKPPVGFELNVVL